MTAEPPVPVPNHPPDGPSAGNLTRVEPGYRHVLRMRLLLFWVPVAIAAFVLDQALLIETLLHWLPTVAVPMLAILSLIMAPRRIYNRLGYALRPSLLQVVRGWLFHVDTLVPFVRVQHIDVTRGPLDKMFGTSTLVVHTAGTHNSVVFLPGLAPDRASAIRDEIRRHIRSDFE